MHLPCTFGHYSRRLNCRQHWTQHLGNITGDIWDAALQSVPVISLSASQKFTTFFILHRVYRTPVNLFQWGRWNSSNALYMEEILIIQYGVDQNWLDTGARYYKQSPLGLYEPVVYLMFLILLYLARKLIACYWLASNPLIQWVSTLYCWESNSLAVSAPQCPMQIPFGMSMWVIMLRQGLNTDPSGRLCLCFSLCL